MPSRPRPERTPASNAFHDTSKDRPVRLYAMLGAAAYALGALFWIYSSDTLLELVFNSPGEITRFQIVKGTAFVVFTALALFWLLHGLFMRIERAELVSSRLNWTQREILDNLPDPVFLLDEEGTIGSLNALGHHVLGREIGHAVGTPFNDYVDPAQRDDIRDALDRAFGGTAAKLECILLTRRGPRPFHVRLRPLTTAAGAVEQVIGIAYDLSAPD